MEVGQRRLVDLLDHAFFTHFIDVIGGRNHQIVCAVFIGFELGVHGFIRLVGRIDNLNAGFFGELFQQTRWDVFSPVIEIERVVDIRVSGAHAQCQSTRREQVA